MTPKERILVIRLIEKAKKYPKYAKKIGVKIEKNKEIKNFSKNT